MSQKVDRNQTIEYLLSYMPLFHKKIFRQVCFNKPPRQHLQLLLHIKKDSGKPMRYYGQKLLISKPNMTTLADKIIKKPKTLLVIDNRGYGFCFFTITFGIIFAYTHVRYCGYRGGQWGY